MFITHDMSVVKHISDDIIVMYLGQIVEKSPAKELFTKQYRPYTQALLSAIPVPSLHNRREKIVIKGELSSPINPENRCRFAGRARLIVRKGAKLNLHQSWWKSRQTISWPATARRSWWIS